MEIKFYKSYNTLIRKPKDALIASAFIRLDTNLIKRNRRIEILQVELVETVDFHLQEELKAKAEAIERYYNDFFEFDGRLKHYLERYLQLKYDTNYCCCCCYEYRSSAHKQEYKELKEKYRKEIKHFLAFSQIYGPFSHLHLEEVKNLVEEYRFLKTNYLDKQVTIPEVLGHITFELELLHSENEFLNIKRNSIKHEIMHNNHEILYLREKGLYLSRQWGTLGIIDSVNYFGNFSVCEKIFRIENDILVSDSPLKNLETINNIKEMGVCLAELFIWVPRLIILLSILINFGRADFFTIAIFLMMDPFLKKRWKMEHYYSSIFMIFCLIGLDIFWFVLGLCHNLYLLF